MGVNASELRANLYRLLDHVIETGEPLVVEKHGRTLRITADPPARRLSRLVRRDDAVSGDAGDLVHLDWSGEWKP